jgi:hypothetical protein
MPMTEVIPSDLQGAVERLHKCNASFAYDIAVIAQFDSRIVWEGIVSVFDLSGHPTASTCYAWSEPLTDTDKRRVFAILKIPPVDSPEAAVRASIMAAHRQVEDHKGMA